MTRKEEIRQAALKYSFDTDGGVTGDLNTGRDDFMAGALWSDAHPKFPWHSVADGDLPKFDTVVLINTKVYGVITALYDKGWVGVEVPLFYSTDCARTANEVNYWMEIPQLPKESEVRK